MSQRTSGFESRLAHAKMTYFSGMISDREVSPVTAVAEPNRTRRFDLARCLILNATYEPIAVVSLKRAVVLVLNGKADVVEATERQIRSAVATIDAPVVVRLRRFVRIPYRTSVPLTRRALFARDGNACAYCGKHVRPLTLDHVIPRAQGGRHRWENVVASCEKCNALKADRTPAEAGMELRVRPYAPAGASALVVLIGTIDEEAWEPYLGVAVSP